MKTAPLIGNPLMGTEHGGKSGTQRQRGSISDEIGIDPQ